MFRSSGRGASRRPISLVLTAAIALGASALVAAPARAGSTKADKAAILKFGVPIEDNGGVFFDPATPANIGNPSGRLWLYLIYDTMIHQTVDGKGAPGLATKWTTPDPSTVELTLRDGVKFSDGAPMTAAAVKAAWDRTITSSRPNPPDEIKSIAAIEAPDEKTVRIKLSKPIAKQFVNTELKNANFLGVPAPSSI